MASPSRSIATGRARRPKRLPTRSRQGRHAPAWCEADLTDHAQAVDDLSASRSGARADRPAGQQRLDLRGRLRRPISICGRLGPAFRHPCQGAGRCWRASFAEELPDGGEGLIVNIIDQRVWRLTPRYFSYTLSKSALWTATRTMAQALAPRIASTRSARPDTAERASADAAISHAQVDGADPEARAGAGRIRRDDPLPLGGALGHRPDDRARRRPASCLADARCDRHGRMSARPTRMPPIPKRGRGVPTTSPAIMPGDDIDEDDDIVDEAAPLAGPDVAFTAIDWSAAGQATPTARSAPMSSRHWSSGCPTRPASTA